MVANNMAAISSHMKQPQHSSPRKEAAQDPQMYAWPFKADARSTKRDMVGSSGMIPSPDDSSNSWEARAFAEDASSLAAGIWPPRAYPCSFCRREFRSAQALGGHMNVHRRDRARLRHSSPPVPICAPLITNQPTSLFQAKQIYSVSPSARHTNDQSLIKLNTPAPISLSKSSYTATPFPLRLQQLASEAAASLCMFPQANESSDLLSLWPPSITTSVDFACHTNIRCSTTPAMKERAALDISSSSSFSSPPSSIVSCGGPPKRDATPSRREAPIIRPEDESPKKKSHTENTNYSQSCGHMIIKAATESLNHGLHAHDIQLTPMKTAADQETSYTERRREVACSGGVDLELRLGQRPP